MAKSFTEQFQTRSGVFAPAAAPTPGSEQPEKESVVDKVKKMLGVGPQPAPFSPPVSPTYAPSLYEQAAGKPGKAASFVEQFNARSGIFSGAKGSGVAAASPEESKRASIASYLDTTPPAVRAAGEEVARTLGLPASPFKMSPVIPSMGFDWTKPQKKDPPPKPDITMPTQEQLDNPAVAKAYQEAVVAWNQPKELTVKIQEAYDSYTESLGKFAENIAIGEVATAQSLLDFVGVYAPKAQGAVNIPIGDVGKNVGRGAGDVADRLQSWLDRVRAPEPVATDLSEAEAKKKIAELTKKGERAIMIPTHETPQYAPSLYDQKPSTYTVAIPKYDQFSDQLAQGIGSSAIFFLPGLGIARGAQILGTVSPRLAMLFGNSASAAIEAMSESGNIYRAQIAAGAGKTKAEQDATKSFWANAILVGLTNRFGAFNPETSGFIRRVVMSSPVEGVQEGAQQMIQNTIQGRDLMEGTGESFLIGLIVGGIMGGGVETLSGEAGGTGVVEPTITGETPPETPKIEPGTTQAPEPTDVSPSGAVATPGEENAPPVVDIEESAVPPQRDGYTFDPAILPEELKPYANSVYEAPSFYEDAILANVPLSVFGTPKFETLNQETYTPGEKITSPIDAVYDIETGKYRITDGANRFTQAVANGDETIPALVEIMRGNKSIAATAPGAAAQVTEVMSAPVYEGPAFRVDTGFTNDKNVMASDVVRYEQTELGNDLGVGSGLLAELDKVPATDLVWVTKSSEDAARYGDDVQQFELQPGARIIAEDTDGGFLVLNQAIGSPEAAAEVQPPAGEVLELKPEDLTKQIDVETQRRISEGKGTASGMPEIAARDARKEIRENVVIQGKKYARPETHVVRTDLRAVVKAARGGIVEFTVEEKDGKKMLVHQETTRLGTKISDRWMRLKPSALGLVDENLKPGQVVRATAENLKEKGTTFRAVGSTGALAFNIKNLEQGTDTAKGNAEIDKIVKRSDIAKNLAKELGVPVRTGHFKDKALGIFKPWAHVIRLKSKLGDLRIPVLVHESAHYIDYTLFGDAKKTKKGKSWITEKFVSDRIPRAELDPLLQEYGGTPGSKKREAFAEFVRYWVTEPAKAEARAPQFKKIWEEEIMPAYPEVRDVLETTRADWQRYQKMPAAAKVVAQISFGEPKKTLSDYKDAIVETWHDTLARWTDDLYPVRRFTMLAREKGVKLDLEKDPYILARLSRGWVGKASVFLEKGTFDVRFWNEVNGKAEPNFTGKGLGEILEPAVRSNSVEDFAAWLVSRRAIELHGREIHSGINETVAAEAFAEISKAHPEFAQMAKDLDAYQTALLTYVYHSGLINEKAFVGMRKLNKDYVPFFRVMEEAQNRGMAGRTMVDLSSPMKRIKGSDRDIINPLESIVKNTYALINAAERNRVGIAMVNLGKQHPELAQLFEDVPAEQTKVASVKINDLIEQLVGGKMGLMLDGGAQEAQAALGEMGESIVNIFRPSMIHDNNILTVMVEGTPKSFHVEPEIYKALQGSEVEDVGVIWKLLSYPARWLRAGATLTPEFMVRNPARDMMSAFVYSNYGFMPPVDVARGLYGMYSKDNAYWLWRMGGGEQSMLVSMDRTTLAKTYEDLSAERNLASMKGVIHLAGKYKNPLEVLRLFSEFTEKMTRVAEAKKAIARGANPLEAAYSAREVTLDFAKIGSKARSLNLIIAFFNASVQGSVRMVNAFKDAPVRTTTKTMLGITLPSILLALWNRQEPDWDEIPQWQKNLFWMLKVNGVWIRFPKPFELGILFGSLPERVMESILDNDPDVWPELRTAIVDGMTPGLLPTSVLPIVENVTNYSFFLDRNIVPDSVEQLPAFAQYTSYTSETSKQIGKWLHYSPAKIDNLLHGYFAGLGTYALQGIDKLARGLNPVKVPPAPTPEPADLPLIKAFVVRDPAGGSSESVNRFYIQAEDARAAAAYFDQLTKKGDTVAAEQWLADHKAEISLAPYYENVRQQLATLRRIQTMVRDAMNMTPEQKRKRIDETDALMTDLAHKAITITLKND